MHHGERLDQFLQKQALAHFKADVWDHVIKSFYVDQVTGGDTPTIKFIWYDFNPEVVSVIQLQYSPEGSSDWQTIPAFNNINPLLSNTFTVDSSMILLLPGINYKFRLSTTSVDGIVELQASAMLHVLIPA